MKRRLLFLLAVGLGALGPAPVASANVAAVCSPLQYGGLGEPDIVVASDLPLQGLDRPQTAQMVRAIRLVFEQSGWRAGEKTVGYQSCDDSTASRRAWDEARCARNARGYADDPKIVAVVGTYNSGCAAIEIPILNEAGIAMVSPANTYPGLTHRSPGTERGEPGIYYPTGLRNYARVVASDDNQGYAMARLAKRLRAGKVFVLHDRELYGRLVASSFRRAMRPLGLRLAGFAGWNRRASNYRALMRRIRASGANAIFLGGISTNNGAQLIRDKVRVLGRNTGRVKLLASDGFVISSLVRQVGARRLAGMFGSAPTVPPERLPRRGRQFVASFRARFNASAIEVYTPYAAQAAEVVLGAIAASDGTRAGVRRAVFATNVINGIVGNFAINSRGDPTPARETVYVVRRGAFRFSRFIAVARP